MYFRVRSAPTCSCVGPDPEERCRAIQHLLRPQEVAHLVKWSHSHPRTRAASAAQVARWLRQRFACGLLRHFHDPPTCDRWCSPAQTLRQGGGDCDDLSILAAAILAQMQTPAVVVTGLLSCRNRLVGHAWVEGNDEGGWYLLEATTGKLFRRARPPTYLAQHFQGIGLCRSAA